MRPSTPGLSTHTVVGAARVGRYELLLELASGGMATVYIGRQRGAAGFERIVAIKRMHPHIGAIPELAASFLDEARIASLIHHPNVVSVHDVHESDGERLLVMDYVEGVSLGALVKAARRHDRRIPVPVAISIISQSLRGLHAAHEQKSMAGVPLNIVHRDATPQNILLGVDGSVRITDFGIAKAAERTAHTSAGNVKGKFRYMSPEQAMGKEIDRRVDIFALGAVLWEMLSGRRFLKGDSDAEIIHNLAMANFEVLNAVEPSISPELSAIVMTAVSEHPEGRWPTAEQFADALDQWARNTGHVTNASELATLVNELCSPQISSRRQALVEVLGGQRPPVSLGTAASVPTDLNTGSNASIAALNTTNFADPLPSSVAPPRPRWPIPLALGVMATFGIGVAIAVSSSSSSSASQTQPAASASAPAAAASTPAPPKEERITVSLTSDRVITEIKGHGVKDIQFKESQTAFTLPKGSEPVSVSLLFVDQSSQELTITPAEDVSRRIVSPDAGKKADKGDKGDKGDKRPGAAGAVVKGPDAAATTTTKAEPAKGLKKNPYD